MAAQRKGKPSPQKGRSYEREVYSPEEIQALLARTAGNAPSAIRNHALISTLWKTGLRINEALELRPNDVDLKGLTLFIRHGKFDKARRVAMLQDLVPEIERWLMVRGRLEKIPPRAPLFCTLQGKKLHATYVRNTLGRLAAGAGWTKRIHPHGFRHTYAVELVKHNISPAFIQRQLGHASLDATTTYLAGITPGDIITAVKDLEFE